MPDIREDKQALDWLANNASDPRAIKVINKLGVDTEDVRAWQWSMGQSENDKKAIKVRNKVFEKVAENRPAKNEMGVSLGNRFVIKNLIDKEPDIQKAYLEKKGYQVRIKENELEVKRPEQTQWFKVDPTGFDIWDVTDLTSDVIEGIATAVATGAKVVGAIGGAAGGGVAGGGIGAVPGAVGGLLAGSAISGAIGGGVETAKQSIAKGIGAREEYNPKLIAEQTALSAALPLGLGLLGKGVAVGGKAAMAPLKEGASAITAAAEKLGVKATPGMLFDSPLVRKLESSLYQSAGKLGGIGLRKNIAANQTAIKEAAESVIELASERTKFETGDAASKSILSAIDEKLAPAKAIYEKYETKFKEIKPDLNPLRVKLFNLKKEYKFDDGALSLINNLESKIGYIKNLNDLKVFRTNVSKVLAKDAPSGQKTVIERLYGPITEIRTNTLLNAAKKEGGEAFEIAGREIKEADKIYKGTISEVEDVLLQRGRNVIRGPKGEAARFFERTEETARLDKILRTNDPVRIEAAKKSFPEAFEILRGGRIQDIMERSMVKGEISPKKMVNIIDKMPSETQNLVFGSDKVNKISALKTYLNSLPDMLGPSGTPQGMEFLKMFNVLSQVSSIGRSAMLNVLTKPLPLTPMVSKGLQTPMARGLGIIGAEQLGLTTPRKE